MKLYIFNIIILCLLNNLKAEDDQNNWESRCYTENLETICQNHELADFCEMYHECAKGGLFRRSEAKAEPVKITFYYESLCPYSVEFLVKHLVPAFVKLHHTGIMDVELIPYGAVKVTKDHKSGDIYECQHGHDECHGSKIHACALHLLHKKLSIPLLGCVAPLASSDDSVIKCTKDTDIDPHEIIDCAREEEGLDLFQKMGKKTLELDPTFKTLPWVLFNGKYSKKTYKAAKKNTVKVICDMYKGEKPKECDDDK